MHSGFHAGATRKPQRGLAQHSLPSSSIIWQGIRWVCWPTSSKCEGSAMAGEWAAGLVRWSACVFGVGVFLRFWSAEEGGCLGCVVMVHWIG